MKEFLNLGKQPLANGFLKEDQIKDEYFYNLKYSFDPETKLVSMVEKPEPTLMFNDKYPYHSSGSATMRKHFKDTANYIKSTLEPANILEIGSNDGVFIKHFPKKNSVCVEPCQNFADTTEKLGYKTYREFWTPTLADKIRGNHGTFDVIYAANCIAHIHDIDAAFSAVSSIMHHNSIFIFEDPSLLKMMTRYSYDQLYDEHPHMFSVTSLSNILKKHDLKIIGVQSIPVHGGSNRIMVAKNSNKSYRVAPSYDKHIFMEEEFGLGKIETYNLFGEAVRMSKYYLQELIFEVSSSGHRLFSYGATAKSTTIFNFVNLMITLYYS